MKKMFPATQLAAYLLGILLPAFSHASAEDALTEEIPLVGLMAGDYRVDQAGSFRYDYEIPVPSSPGGLNPSLRLSYDAQGSVQFVGEKFVLKGLSRIERCEKTPRIHGYSKAIQFDSSDEFCLDGSPLVEVNQGESGNREFRVRQEQYSKIEVDDEDANGPLQFTVYTKQGEIRTFGGSEDGIYSKDSNRLIWFVKEISDRSGNHLSYEYENLGDQIVPRMISYGGNKAASLAHYSRVEFEFTFTENPATFVSGFEIKSDRRLEKLIFYRFDKSVFEVQFSYKHYANRMGSYLSELRQCPEEKKCLKPLSFEWQDPSKFSSTEVEVIPSEFSGLNPGWDRPSVRRNLADVSGDGIPDLVGFNGEGISVQLGTPQGFSPQQKWSDDFTAKMYGSPEFWSPTKGASSLIDINGDGLIDMIAQMAEGFYVALGTGDRFLPWSNWLERVEYRFAEDYWHISYPIYYTDMTGDGLVDIVGFGSLGIYVAVNKKDQFEPPTLWSGYPDGMLTRTLFELPRFLADIDNDNRPDIIIPTPEGIIVGRNRGPGNITFASTDVFPAFLHENGWSHKSFKALRDFNRDGNVDILGVGFEGLYVAYGTGDGFIFDPNPILENHFSGYLWKPQNSVFDFSDFNGDGYVDIIGWNSTGLYVALNEGQTFKEPELISTFYVYKPVWYPRVTTYLVDDLDGDGQAEFIGIGYLGLSVTKFNRSPSRLIRVTDSLGKAIEVDYAPLTDKDVYKKGEGAAYPINEISAPLSVVKAITLRTDPEHSTKTAYFYEQLRTHKVRGGIGFSQITETNLDSSTSVVSTYSQDFDERLEGTLKEKKIYVDEKLISHTFVEWEVHLESDHDGLHYSLHKISEQTRNFDDDGELVSSLSKTYEYDSYGSPTAIVMEARNHDSYVKTVTAHTYFSNKADWLIAKLSSAVVTHQRDLEAPITRKSVFEYDVKTGLLIAETTDPDTRFEIKKQYLSRDDFGNILKTKVTWHPSLGGGLDFDSVISKVKTDRYGRVVEKENAKGHLETIAYDQDHFILPKTITDANNLKTTFTYDDLGQLIATKFPDRSTQKVSRSWCDEACAAHGQYQITQLNPGELTPKITIYDASERVIEETSTNLTGERVTTKAVFDRFGRLSQESLPFKEGKEIHWISYEYDPKDRLIETLYPDGNRDKATYEHNQVTTIDARGHRTRRVLGIGGEPLVVEDALTGVISYKYNSLGELTELTDPLGRVRRAHYDLLGRKTRLIDPDKGTLTFEYNAFGLPAKRVDGKSQVTLMDYDELGRMIKKTSDHGGPNETSEWVEYDRAENGIGLMAHQRVANAHERFFTYDSLSRLTEVTSIIDGDGFVSSRTYDRFSRLKKYHYPSGMAVSYHYNEQSYLTKIADADHPSKIFWKAETQDEFGNITSETYGNGTSTQKVFDEKTGLLISSKLTDKKGDLFAHNYRYDEIGNLVYRDDEIENFREEFSYDSLNRLILVSDSEEEIREVSYDAIGNILHKTHVGDYKYGLGCTTGRRQLAHALVSLPHKKYCYDDNGNIVQNGQQKLTYDFNNKPILIDSPGQKTQFHYGIGGVKTKRRSLGQNQKETIYVEDTFEVVTTPKGVIQRHYIGQSIILDWSKDAREEHYLFHDHLGSIVGSTDAKGLVSATYRYDPWGVKSSLDKDFDTLANLDHGFTGHEHIEEHQLVDMGGRIYDQSSARFLSPDPYIQAPELSQNLNRFAYVLNNPLSATDPSGFFFKKLQKAGSGLVRGITNAGYKVNKWFNNSKKEIAGVAIVAVGTSLAPFTAGTSASLAYAMAVGATSGYVSSGGDYRAAAIGAISAGIFNGIGTVFAENMNSLVNHVGELGASGLRVMAHGSAGGFQAVASGGMFEHGFVSAGITQAAGVAGMLGSDAPEGWYGVALNAATSSVVGGLGAELSGGTFEDGATTGAYSRLFNDLMHVPEKRYVTKNMVVLSCGNEGYLVWFEGEAGLEADFTVEAIFSSLGAARAGVRSFLGTKSAVQGLSANPFKGKSFKQIDKMLRSRGFTPKGPNPAAGKGSYINSKTGRMYYLDKGGVYRKGVRELPHVDVHRVQSSLPKRKYPLGDKLID